MEMGREGEVGGLEGEGEGEVEGDLVGVASPHWIM